MSTPYDTRPWLRYYPTGVPSDVDAPDVPLTHLLDDAAARFPRRNALIFFGRRLTYRQLRKATDRFAGALRSLGVHKGDRVALILPNCPQQVIAFYGTLRRGAMVVMHNPLYTASELHYQLADSGARVVVVFDRAYETLAEALDGTDVEHVIVTSLFDWLPATKRMLLRLPLKRIQALRAELSAELPYDANVVDFDELLKTARVQHRQTPVIPQRDLALLQYTGGTTGRPKGAMLTHYNMVANALQSAAWDPAIRPGREVTLAVLPLFHVFGLTFGLTTTMLICGTVVLLPRFELRMVLQAVRKWKPTIFPGVPPIFAQLAASPKARKSGLASVRTCVSGAMRLPRTTVDAFRAATGARVVQGYGLTETSPVVMANPLNGNARHVSVGVPVPGTDARIVHENDPQQAVPIGYPGELLVRGPQVFHGYWNQPTETAETLVGGWVRTGDIAVMSPDGFFTLIDRKRDVIIVDGLNVYPSEVEDALNRHPMVEDCAIVGVPDLVHGEAVKAFVIPAAGYEPSGKELADYCANYVAGYKVPTMVEIRSTLPRNILGKVLRRVLREEHATRSGTR